METTLRTCHRARCPVLAVSGSFENPKNVIIATDFSTASARAAEAALPMFDSAATVTLLHDLVEDRVLDRRTVDQEVAVLHPCASRSNFSCSCLAKLDQFSAIKRYASWTAGSGA